MMLQHRSTELRPADSGRITQGGTHQMATMVGGDLEQLQMLEQQFRNDSQAVAELRARITNVLASTAWTGPAAEQFRQEWNGTFSSALNSLAASLQDNAGVVANRRQAIAAATS